MLGKKKFLEVWKAIEEDPEITVRTDKLEIIKIIALIEIREQLDRLGEIIMDFKLEYFEDMNKILKEVESEEFMKVKNIRTNEPCEAEIAKDSMEGFFARALISLGVLIEVTPPAPAEEVQKAEKDFEKSVDDKAAEKAADIGGALGLAAAADRAAAAEAAAEQQQAPVTTPAQKAADQAAAAEAQARLAQGQGI